MGLTSISQVRQHLNRVNFGECDVRDQSLRLTSTEYVYLPHAHLVVDSESIKAVESDVPMSEVVTLGLVPVSLSHSMIVSGSVVCASDSSLSVIYQENTDFAINYASGTITRISSGAILQGQSVYVWYQYYRVYLAGLDYQIDYTRGAVRRLSEGNIEEGQEVLIDYRLGSTQFSDDEIGQAIFEGEAELAHLIHPDFQESTDAALQTAATSLALSILCRNAAGMAFSGAAYSEKAPAAWLELSDSYRRTALRLSSWFGKESPSLRAPRLG